MSGLLSTPRTIRKKQLPEMTYPILPVEEFGAHLLESQDLDPVYVILQSIPDRITAARWCLAYWCLYHAGLASYVAERPTQGEYWAALREAACNQTACPVGGRWPRGTERRHWRGANALKSLDDLERRYLGEPAGFVDLAQQKAPSFEGMSNFVQSHSGFGPWMAFKVCDMMEQVFGCTVDFSRAAVFMFDAPKEAALLVWKRKAGLPENVKVKNPQAAIDSVVDYLCDYFGSQLAPNKRRAVGLQEVETILCKWKSHKNGHYPLNNDLEDVHHQLSSWCPVSSLANDLLSELPRSK